MSGFSDRRHAGKALAARLRQVVGREEVLVLGLPRGGVPVAFEVARALNAPLDILVVRKLGYPGHAELGMGAIASGGIEVLNSAVVRSLQDPGAAVAQAAEHELPELHRREIAYRRGRPARDCAGKTVIVVDDGLATGATMRAAIAAVRQRGARKVIAAVPVGSPESCRQVADCADELICLIIAWEFNAVGQFYEDFSQTTDEEVCELLDDSLSWERAEGSP